VIFHFFIELCRIQGRTDTYKLERREEGVKVFVDTMRVALKEWNGPKTIILTQASAQEKM